MSLDRCVVRRSGKAACPVRWLIDSQVQPRTSLVCWISLLMYDCSKVSRPRSLCRVWSCAIRFQSSCGNFGCILELWRPIGDCHVLVYLFLEMSCFQDVSEIHMFITCRNSVFVLAHLHGQVIYLPDLEIESHSHRYAEFCVTHFFVPKDLMSTHKHMYLRKSHHHLDFWCGNSSDGNAGIQVMANLPFHVDFSWKLQDSMRFADIQLF